MLKEELQRNFRPPVRFEKIDRVLTMLGDMLEAAVSIAEKKQLLAIYLELIETAKSDGHYVIVTLLLWHGYDLIHEYGTAEDIAMAEGVIARYKALPAKERQKYNFTELVYDRLAAYERQLITDVADFRAAIGNGALSPEAEEAKRQGLWKALCFVKAIPVPYGYTIAKYMPVGSGYVKVVIQSEILKFAYLKIRLFEAAAWLYSECDAMKSDWANDTAMKTANKFRDCMRDLKLNLDKIIRHAKEDDDRLTVYLNQGTYYSDYNRSADAITFNIATQFGFEEKTFTDFFSVYPQSVDNNRHRDYHWVA